MKILIIGRGYIGPRCKEAWGDEAILSDKRINSVEDVVEEIEKYQPDAVLNAAGRRGFPNVDWCESHQFECLDGNTKLPILIAQACHKTGIYLLHVGSGCVFYGQSPDPKGWKEDDFANPIAYYSKCKYATDLVLGSLPNVGIARIRVPLDDRPYPGNIIDKLAGFSKIIDVENSITIIPDMTDIFYQLMERKSQGIFHVTNPGSLKYKDLMAMYSEMVDPSQLNEWITEEDLVNQGLTEKTRSTNKLQSFNLEKEGISMTPIDEALKKAFKTYAPLKKLELGID